VAVRIVNDVKHYEFGIATFVFEKPDGTVGLDKDKALTLYASETSPDAPIALGADRLPLTAPRTNQSGQSPSLWSPQFDTVFADAGAGRLPLVCLDFAEAINDVAATAASLAAASLEDRLQKIEADVAGKSIGRLALGQMPEGLAVVVDYEKGTHGAAPNSWPTARPTTRPDMPVFTIGPLPHPAWRLTGDQELRPETTA